MRKSLKKWLAQHLENVHFPQSPCFPKKKNTFSFVLSGFPREIKPIVCVLMCVCMQIYGYTYIHIYLLLGIGSYNYGG